MNLWCGAIGVVRLCLESGIHLDFPWLFSFCFPERMWWKVMNLSKLMGGVSLVLPAMFGKPDLLLKFDLLLHDHTSQQSWKVERDQLFELNDVSSVSIWHIVYFHSACFFPEIGKLGLLWMIHMGVWRFSMLEHLKPPNGSKEDGLPSCTAWKGGFLPIWSNL